MGKKKLIVILLLLLLFLWADSVYATSIMYTITKGNDFLGNDFNGFVCFNEDANIHSGIKYGITSFAFNSVAGSFSGNSGYLDFDKGQFPDTVSLGDATANFKGIFTDSGGVTSDIEWDNDMTGVWFKDENGNNIDGSIFGSIENYSILPEQISIFMDCMAESAFYPELGKTVCLSRVSIIPVPEPSSVLFFIFSLIWWTLIRVKSKCYPLYVA